MRRPFIHPAVGVTINDQFASFAYTQPADPSPDLPPLVRRLRIGTAELRAPSSSVSFYGRAAHRNYDTVAWMRRSRQRLALVEHVLSDPAVISPTPLPLDNQRRILERLAGRTRAEAGRRRPGYRLRPVPNIVDTPSIQQKLRTITVKCALRPRVEDWRRKPRSYQVFPPGVITGSVLTVFRSPSTPAALSAPVVHGAPVLIAAPPWRFVITDLNSATITFLEKSARQREVVFTLNQPWTANCTVDSTDPEVNLTDDAGDPFVAEGTRLLYAFRREGAWRNSDGAYAPWICRFAGLVLQIEDTVPDDNPQSVVTAFDPWTYLFARPVCFADGSLPGEAGMQFNGVKGSDIALTLLRNTITNHGPCYIDAGITNGGTSFYGSIASMDATAEININFQQGCTVGEAWQQLCDTDTIDLVLRPIYDPLNRPGYTSELGIHQQLGIDRPGAIMAWDLPSRSITNIDRLEDGTQRANEMQFFLQNGVPIATQFDAPSIVKFKEWWALQTFSGETTVSAVVSYAKAQLAIRRLRSSTIKINPAPERSPVLFQEFNIGDTLPIYASKRLRKPINGSGRVYSIPIDIGDDSVETIKEMDFSSDSLVLGDLTQFGTGSGLGGSQGTSGGQGGGSGDLGGVTGGGGSGPPPTGPPEGQPGPGEFSVTISGGSEVGDTLTADIETG